jgi:hypothetical protein
VPSSPVQQAGDAASDAVQLCWSAAELLGCCNLGCTNLEGMRERELDYKRCGACGAARYCSAACQKAAWAGHKVACGLVAATRARGGQQP